MADDVLEAINAIGGNKSENNSDKFSNYNIINEDGVFVASLGLLKTQRDEILPVFEKLAELIGCQVVEKGHERETPKLDLSRLNNL